MDTPPIGEYDVRTDLAENTGPEPVYAEMVIDFPSHKLTGELTLSGFVGGSDHQFKLHESEERHPKLVKAQLFYESNEGPLGIEDYEYRLIIDVESFSISGRIAVPLEEDTAETLIEKYSDGVWNYAE